MKHEWVNVFGIEICHWCGLSRAQYNDTDCRSKTKITTKTEDGKPKVEYRQDKKEG